MLNIGVFEKIVKFTPLISIDLIVKNHKNKILLGKRNNRPAKGFWFVPGGRVLKDEPLSTAFHRLIKEELNIEQSCIESEFIGVYQHFYDDNFSRKQFSTHYIVLAYTIKLNGLMPSLPSDQHSQYQWFSEIELLKSNEVHEYTKWYVQENKQADTMFDKTENFR